MDRTDILNAYVTDMAAVETHIHDAVTQQLDADATSSYPEAATVLSRLQTTLKRHVDTLEAYNAGSEGGGLREAAKEALGSALGFAAGLYNKMRDEDQVSRMLRDTYTATSLATVSYHMLYTTALALKDERLATLAMTNLKDLTDLIGELSESVVRVVVRELTAEDKTLDATVAEEAVRKTQEAWRNA